MLWHNGWDIWCNIFGIIAIVGPLLLVGWYFKEAKARFKRLNEAHEANKNED